MAEDARRYREMSNEEYRDLVNGRITVEAILSVPDYADRIAEKIELDHEARMWSPREVHVALAQAAREGYTAGYGAAQ